MTVEAVAEIDRALSDLIADPLEDNEAHYAAVNYLLDRRLIADAERTDVLS